MNIFLIRHGYAENIGAENEKGLTPRGIEILKETFSILNKIEPKIDLIVSSPLARAMQTAKLLHRAYNLEHEIITEMTLAHGASTELLLSMLDTLPGDNIAFVGHQPDMSYHVSNLISNSGASVTFFPGTVAKIRFDGLPRMRAGVLELLFHG
jgi:phosphohistidine phosphatase